MIARALGLAALLSACNHHPGFPNAPLDAAADALPTTPDAGPGAVSVTVTLRGSPLPGIAVYFQAADSSLVLAAATDAAGTASAVLAAGGYATVIEPADHTGATPLVTFAATQPGDALHIDLEPTGPLDMTTFTATVPTNVAAQSYQLDTSCGDVGADVSADVSGSASGALIGCGGAAADMIVMALDGVGETIGSLYTTDVPVGGQPVAIGGGYTPLVSTRFSYTGVPATSTTVTTLQRLATARGVLFAPPPTSAPVSAGTATGRLDMPMTTATAITVSEALPVDADPSEQVIFDWAPWSATYSLDFASAMLPPLAGVPAYDAGTRTVSWVEGTGATAPNLVRARIHAFRDAIPEGRAWTWEIVAPHGGGSVAFPRFPAGGFDFTPTASDGPSVADLVLASVPGGYDGVRAHGFDKVQSHVTGPNGRLVIETLHSPQL